jgi:hypothetical protein
MKDSTVKWQQFFGVTFGVYGLIMFLIFVSRSESQRIYVSDQEESLLILERRRNWGFRKERFELKYFDNGWKWRKETGIRESNGGLHIIDYSEWTSASLSLDVLDAENIRYDLNDD